MSIEFKNIKEVLQFILDGGAVIRKDRPGKIYKLNEHNNIAALKTALGSPFLFSKHVEKKREILRVKYVYFRNGKWVESKRYYKSEYEFKSDFPTITKYQVAQHTAIMCEE